MIYIKQYDAKFMSLAIWVLNMLTPDRLKCASSLVLKLRSVSSFNTVTGDLILSLIWRTSVAP